MKTGQTQVPRSWDKASHACSDGAVTKCATSQNLRAFIIAAQEGGINWSPWEDPLEEQPQDVSMQD